MDALRPVRERLLDSLSAIYRDRDVKREPTERSLATNILADYAADQPQVLADLLMDADEKQFAVLYPTFKEHSDRGLTSLSAELDKQPGRDATEDTKETL